MGHFSSWFSQKSEIKQKVTGVKSKNLQSHAVLKLYIRTNEANIPRCSIHIFIINNNHAYLILFIYLIFIEDEHHNSVFPPLRALQVQCTTSHAFMQACQQANYSYGGFAKVVPFSHFFYFFYFSFPSGIPWADFDMGRE